LSYTSIDTTTKGIITQIIFRVKIFLKLFISGYKIKS